MNNKYKDGNYLLNYSLENLNVVINPNYANNCINFIFNPLYGAPIKHLNFNLVSYDNPTSSNLRLDLYNQLTYDNNKYIIYDCFNNYDEYVYETTTSNETIYKSNHMRLYVYNNSNYAYKIEDISTKESLYFTNIADIYPSKIELLNGDEINLEYLNNSLILTSHDEIIEMIINNNIIIGFNYKKIINNDETLLFSSFLSFNQDNTLMKIEYKIYEETYYTIKELNFSYDNLEIDVSDEATTLGFVKDNTGKICQIIDRDTIDLTYTNNVVNIDDGVYEYKLIFDYYNRIKYVCNNLGYYVYDYNNNSLLTYKSDLIYFNSNSLFNNLSSYTATTYESDDEYDDTNYEFNISGYSMTIEPELQTIIGNSPVYKVEGTGTLDFFKKKYGETNEEILVIFYIKYISISSYVSVYFYYKASNVSHTMGFKTISFDSNETGFMPVIISVKPKNNYDYLYIKINVDGNIYLTSPRVIKTTIGSNYTYNTENLLALKRDSSGDTHYYYNNNNQLIKTVKNDIETNITRNESNNITKIKTGDKEYIFHYDELNRITYSKINNETVSYIYTGSNIIYKNYENYTEKDILDNYGRIIQKKINNDNYEIIYNYIYNHDIKVIQITNSTNNITYTFDNRNNMIYASDDGSVVYHMTYDNKDRLTSCDVNSMNLEGRGYNNDNLISTRTIDNFGTYAYTYNTEKELVGIYYNSILKYMFEYNNKKQLFKNGYNIYYYDEYNNIKENYIQKIANDYITIKCYRDGIRHNLVNDTIRVKDIYSNSTHNLKDDYYYSNISFNDNPNITLVNTSNTILVNSSVKFYPLISSFRGLNDEEPIDLNKQSYKLYYYDKDINNYGLLLYGQKLEVETNITNELYVSLEIKLEDRTINQAIMFISSMYNSILVYRDTNKKIVIKYNNTDTNTNIIMTSNNWHKIDIWLKNSSIHFHLDNLYYYVLDDACQSFGINTIVTLGYYSYFENMTTFGIVRNLFTYNSYLDILEEYYYDVSKSDSYDINNNLINQEIRLNNEVIISKDITRYEGHPYDLTENYMATRGQITNSISTVKYQLNGLCYINDILISLNCYDGTTHTTRYSYEYDSNLRIKNETIINVCNQPYNRGYVYDEYNNVIEIKNKEETYTYERFVYDPFSKYRLIEYQENIDGSMQTNLLTYYSYGFFIQSFMNQTYQYEGTNLTRYNNYEYVYNSNGQRIRKYNQNTNVMYYYYYDTDGKLLIEERPTYKMRFLYDSNNMIYGFIKEDNNIHEGFEIFYYLIDELGIIYGIMDSKKRLLGTYRYNAYGKILEVKQAFYTEDDCNPFIEHANFIMDINPIRYKSYYYDVESEMYYLNNRYYYPRICRFLTPDKIDYIDLYNPKSYNLFSYCYNNPVMFSDPSGNLAISTVLIGMAIGAIIGAAVGGTIAYNVTKENGKTGWELFGWTFLGAVGGGIIGGALGAGIGAFVTHSTGILGLSITKYSILPIKSVTVLGTMPGYISAATATGSGYYLISEKLWDSMTAAEQWYNNSQYISDANKLGSQFAIFAESVPKEGSSLLQEIQFLIEHNIPWSMH